MPKSAWAQQQSLRKEIIMTRKITLQEAADTYSVSERTLRRYIASGRLRAWRVGPRLIRLDAEQVAEQLLGEPIG